MSRQKVNVKNMPAFKKALERRSVKAIPRLLGMKDIVPSEFRYFSAVSNKAAALAELYSFNAIKTPIIESADLYKKSTRHNNKELYTLDCEKGENGALRPELTQGILRAYI